MSQPAPAPHGRTRVAVGGAFLAQGFVFVLLTTKLPHLQEQFHLDPGAFSLYMLGLVVCAGVGSLMSEFVAARAGSGLALRGGLLVVAGALPLIALAATHLQLALTMCLYGLGLGIVDAGCNMQGVGVEHLYGRTIMPTFHAAWTFGGALATVVAWLSRGLSLEATVCLVAALPAVMAFAPFERRASCPRPDAASTTTTTTSASEDAPQRGRETWGLPWRRIMLVGLALVLFYMVDTAVTAWGPSFVHRTFGAGGGWVALATLPYLLTSLVGRGVGDALTARWGAVALVRVAALVGAAGLAVVVFAPSAVVAMLGFCIVGLGTATVAPLSFSVAARIGRAARPGGDPHEVRASVDAVIARFNQFNYAGALLGAVMTGAVGDDSLRYGFAVPMVLVVLLAPLARVFR